MATFRGTKSFYEYELNDQISINLKSKLEYGLLEMGAYTNITLASDYSTLQYVNGAYEGLNQWIWESGVSPLNGQNPPLQVSGVWLNNTFYGLNQSLPVGGTYYVDYKNGRIVTQNATKMTGTLKCEYSTRNISVYTVDSPQWRTIVNNFVNRYLSIGTNNPSGIASYLKERRVWLPCVIVDVKSTDGSFEGLQLGGGEIPEIKINYHVFSDSPFANRRLLDVITSQDQTTINLFNANSIPQIYNYNGNLTGSGVKYPSLTNPSGQYFWAFGYFDDVQGEVISTDSELYRAECRSNLQVYRYNSTY